MGSAIKTFQHDACVFIAQAGAVEGSKASACDAESSGSNPTRSQNIIHDSRKNLNLKENSPFSGISENNRWVRCAQKKPGVSKKLVMLTSRWSTCAAGPTTIRGDGMVFSFRSRNF